MLWLKFRGDPKIGDITHEDKNIVNMIFFAGLVVTLMACLVFVMFGLL